MIVDTLVIDEIKFEIYKRDLLLQDGVLNPAIEKILLKPEGKKAMSWEDFQRGYL